MATEKRWEIDITPSWTGLMPLFIEWLATGTQTQKDLAKSELIKVGKIADAYVALSKEGKV